MKYFFKGVFVVIIVFVAASFVLEHLAPYNPWKRFEPYQPPGSAHWLGTNDMGQDILSELMAGSKVSLLVGLISALLSSAIGLMLGLISGYFRGKTDNVIMGLTDIFLTIPKIPLLIVFTAFLRPDFWMIGIILGLLWWPSTALVVRSKTKQVRERGFIESSRCLGFKNRQIIFSDILPNIQDVVYPKFLINLATAMSAEASISFLGLGDPSVKSWGMMINYAFAKGGFVNNMWWWIIPPGFCLLLAVFVTLQMGFRMEEAEKHYFPIEGIVS
jgi:peptide/nickel transport system permease protein